MNANLYFATENSDEMTIDESAGKNSFVNSGLPFDIVEGLRQGSVKAFESVYTHMGGPIEDFITLLIQSREDARELTQDVFIRIWENHTKIESGKNLKGYIYTLSKFVALDYLKRRKVADKYVDAMMYSSNPLDYSTDDVIDAKETELLIHMALEAMPEVRRRAFQMSKFEGVSDDEIAKELKLTKATVQVYVSNVSKELRKLIKLLHIIFMI